MFQFSTVVIKVGDANDKVRELQATLNQKLIELQHDAPDRRLEFPPDYKVEMIGIEKVPRLTLPSDDKLSLRHDRKNTWKAGENNKTVTLPDEPLKVDGVGRFFDSDAWVSGTNTFIDAAVGPTSVAVGSGEILGTSLTLDASKGLVVGVATTITGDGTLTLERPIPRRRADRGGH